MPNTVVLTLTDTLDGGVAIHSDFKPAIGMAVSPSQQYSLDVIARTHRQWGVAASQGGVQLNAVEHHLV
jgi:hypothetical protein